MLKFSSLCYSNTCPSFLFWTVSESFWTRWVLKCFWSTKFVEVSVVCWAFGLYISGSHKQPYTLVYLTVREFSKQSVMWDSRGLNSGYVCQPALEQDASEGSLFGVGVLCRAGVWGCGHALSRVTSATAFDSPSLFSNHKRVSVWVSLKACPEIWSMSLYSRPTGTACDLTGSRSSCPSSMDPATCVCVSGWVCVVFCNTPMLLCAV